MKIYFNIHLPNVLTFIEYPSACTQEAPVDHFQIIDGELSRNCVFIVVERKMKAFILFCFS